MRFGRVHWCVWRKWVGVVFVYISAGADEQSDGYWVSLVLWLIACVLMSGARHPCKAKEEQP